MQKKKLQEALEKQRAALSVGSLVGGVHSPTPQRKVDAAERDLIIDRLYGQAILQKQKSLEKMEQTIYYSKELGQQKKNKNGRPATCGPKKVNAAGLKAAVTKLYTEAVENKKKSYVKLEEQYTWKKVIGKTMTADEIKESALRLTSKPK